MTRLLACADCDRREFDDDSAHAARAQGVLNLLDKIYEAEETDPH